MTRWTTRLKQILTAVLETITRRHVVFLPKEASSKQSILDLETTYRVETGTLRIKLKEPHRGRLKVAVLGYDRWFPTRELWATEVDYDGPCVITIDAVNGNIHIAGKPCGELGVPLSGRRFCCELAFVQSDGTRRARTTGHYLPGGEVPIEEDYFVDRNYIDYEAQVGDEPAHVVSLLRRHAAASPVLELGCATGCTLRALGEAGFDAFGLDISSWAVDRANEKLGEQRAWCCDVENEPFPAQIVDRAPYRAIVLWSVFEHFREPYRLLERFADAGLLSQDALLVLNTTNADGLTHYLFGRQWEGHFDYTHHGVDDVGVRSLREQLPNLGWEILEMRTSLVWNVDADPTRATLRDWYAADGRFRKLLEEQDRGDLLECVAVRRG